MGRLTVEVAARADARTGEFVEAFARRVEAMPPGQCPVGLMLGQLQASAAQTCGKCTPCAQGMPKLAALLGDVAAFRATAATVDEMPRCGHAAARHRRLRRGLAGGGDGDCGT